MCAASRRQELEHLERELKTEAYGALLQELKRHSHFLGRFDAWPDVVAFMRAGTSDDPRKDEVLKPILAAHGRNGCPRCTLVLTVIFWPALESIARKSRKLSPDQDELWQDVHCTFLEVLGRIDLAKRSARLVQKIYNDTHHRLRDKYRRRQQLTGRETPTCEEELEVVAGVVPDIDFDGIAVREWQEAELDRFRRHLVNGTIPGTGFEVLAATRVRGMSVSQYAAEVGIGFQAAKKRRQRAEEAIRRAESADYAATDVPLECAQGAF